PDAAAESEYAKWNVLVPKLVEPILRYNVSSFGAASGAAPSAHCEIKDIRFCKHKSVVIKLADEGLFASSPFTPGYAYSIDLLNLFLDLMRNGGNSVESLAASLHEQHRGNGYIVRNKNKMPIQEGFRRTLGHAIQWYDQVRALSDIAVQERIARARVEVLYPAANGTAAASEAGASTVSASQVTPPPTPHHIAQYLVNRCPSCFAAARTGRPLTECDFHFALDGNFGHRHNCTASNCPHIVYDMRSFVPKDFVDAVGAAHDECRQRPARSYDSVVPLAAVKACESSHTAADGSRVKCGGEKHDDRGLVAIVCRHDVPLFICNVDTPGEQFKYGLALLLWTSMHLPDNATILCLYDIGCVAHKIIQSYDLLGEQLEARVAFATSAMHAYAHQWECQIVYSPRLNPSYGLSDGEGCERLWLRIRKLISNLRSAARQMRLITLDRHVQFVADAIRDDSGRWLGRKWAALKTREYEARKEIALSGHSAQFLREQWASQREAQLQVRRMTAPRLRKELEAVMALQDQIEAVEESIVSAQSAIDNSRAPSEDAREHLSELRATLEQLTHQADALYASLNVEQAFPAIQDFGIDFVRALIMCYDAKCIARRKLTGRFFEYDHLDQAAGGSGEPLGTKQHQRVLQSIQRRPPAIHNAIARYNTCCARVRELVPAGRTFPLPQPLPTDISKLRNDPALLEDVWVSNIPAGCARWLTDSTVRGAIRAQLSLDRCAVERTRLVREESQLLEWLKLEARAITVALYAPQSP
ncbi:hypothetical protein AURDEDRAFT_76906, partial [Auricularia subglabra TFB-10046 SS5]